MSYFQTIELPPSADLHEAAVKAVILLAYLFPERELEADQLESLRLRMLCHAPPH